MDDTKGTRAVMSLQALRRIPYYLHYLKQLRESGVETVAAPEIAENLRFNEVQVRKDFAAVSTNKGKPKVGFLVGELIYNMEEMMMYHNTDEAVLVGAGALGRALLSYGGFDGYGMNIVAAFDIDENVVGQEIRGKKVLPVSQLSGLCARMGVHIGIAA